MAWYYCEICDKLKDGDYVEYQDNPIGKGLVCVDCAEDEAEKVIDMVNFDGTIESFNKLKIRRNK